MTKVTDNEDFARHVQSALGLLVDGWAGAKTRAAFDVAVGRVPVVPDAVTDLPWMVEGKRLLGRHEARDNNLLRRWLRSDGKTLGDPAKLPWCGDFVETCIKLALPSEPFPGAVGENPYWARNWLGFGIATKPTYGAVLVFERGPSSGHVGFAVGQDSEAFHVLGGNQSNAVTVARVAKRRLLGARWPRTFAATAIHLPAMNRDGTLSSNEA